MPPVAHHLARIGRCLLDNLESLLEGAVLFVCFWYGGEVLAVVAGIGWPTWEIYNRVRFGGVRSFREVLRRRKKP